MNIVKAKHVSEDTGNCRSYYRTINSGQLICLQEEGIQRIWYVCIDDGCWDEPDYAIDMELNEIEIVN